METVTVLMFVWTFVISGLQTESPQISITQTSVQVSREVCKAVEAATFGDQPFSDDQKTTTIVTCVPIKK